MTDVRVETRGTRAGLEALRAAIGVAANTALREAMAVARDTARKSSLFKDRSGKTRESIRGDVSGARGFLSAGGAAIFLENGTVAHTITARRAKALRFVVGGSAVFRRSVQHPGTEPRPFMSEARAAGARAAEYAAEIYVGGAIGRG